MANVDRCFDLIERLAARPDGASLGELAAAAALPKSATHRLLQALAARGYVMQDEAGQAYQLSAKLATLGFRYLDARRLPDIVQGVLDTLARDTGEYCRLAVVEGAGLAWIARAQGALHGLRYDPPMDHEVVLHATATGKAWLATLPEEEALSRVYCQGFGRAPGFGPRVVTTVDALREHLRQTRERGYAVAIEEGGPGTVAMAVVFRTHDGPDAPVGGTVSVAGPLARLSEARLHALAPRVMRASGETSALWPLRSRQRALQ